MAGSPHFASENPIARVLPLLDVPHLDRPFDYSVPTDLSDTAQPGVRVRVTFHGRQVDGYVLERCAQSDFPGKLTPIRKVTSPHPVFTGSYRELVEWTAHRYAGTIADVIRLAIPPRVARVDKEEIPATRVPDVLKSVDADLSCDLLAEESRAAWGRYRWGTSMVAALPRGGVRAAWQLLPHEDLAARACDLITVARAAGGSVLILVPDQYDLDPLYNDIVQRLGDTGIAALSAASGQAPRYRNWLYAFYGVVDVVIGTRGAAFTPLRNLHTVLMVDDGNDIYADLHAPYPHLRDVLAHRAESTGANFLAAGWSCSVAMSYRVEEGWAHYLQPEHSELKKELPRITAPGDSDKALERDPLARAARIPHTAFRAVKAALERNEPVLFQVPRRGYIPTLVCGNCREPARCRHCGGPLGLSRSTNAEGASIPVCRWCGTPEPRFTCQHCGSHTLRAATKGAGRTTEELGRAFPGFPVVLSYGDERKERIAAGPMIVVSTPGSEPVAPSGYGAVVLLDPWALTQRPDLSADEDTLRLWCNAVRLVRPFSQGGEAIIAGEPRHPLIQGLIRWDPVGVAERLCAERESALLPPSRHFIAIDGPFSAVKDFVSDVTAEVSVDTLGPIELPVFESLPASCADSGEEPLRMLLRDNGDNFDDILSEVRKISRYRSAKTKNIPVRIHVDPTRIG